MASLIADLWAGRLPLARAFWEYCFIWGLLLNVFATIGSLMVLAMHGPAILAVVLHLAPVPWSVLTLVAVWRSAEASSVSETLRLGARIAATAWTVLMIVV